MAKTKQLDPKVLEALREVKRRKDEISRAERPDWKTNCLFCYEEGKLNQGINIHVVSSVHDLTRMAGFLLGAANSYYQAAEQLGLELPVTFTWNGFPLVDWIWDIRQRVTKITIEKKKQQLNALEKRLDALVSPEKRAELELADITAALKG